MSKPRSLPIWPCPVALIRITAGSQAIASQTWPTPGSARFVDERTERNMSQAEAVADQYPAPYRAVDHLSRESRANSIRVSFSRSSNRKACSSPPQNLRRARVVCCN